MNISIFGLGYVGAVSLACLARDGHEVTGVDVDDNKLTLIREGKAPIVEEGIQETMAEAVGSGRVRVTSVCAEAIASTDVSFVCVGTPSRSNGDQDQSAILRVCEQIGDALKTKDGFHVVVIRSTVQPGTLVDKLAPILEEHSGKRNGTDFALCFQPEFLREGSSIRDYDNPPYTVIGTDSTDAAEMLKQIFGDLPCEFIVTDISTAECLKYACNAFHALKVTFANEIARVAQSQGADSHDIMQLVCKDTRLNISPAYLRPGFAFGGSCLPKDLRALLYMARGADVEIPMLASLLPSNKSHIEHAIQTVMARGERSVGMIGLSFKSGTDDLRESPLVTLAETFIGKGLDLRIYDPEVNVARLTGANRRYIDESIPHIASLMTDSCEAVIEHGKTLIVGLNDAPVMETLYNSNRDDQFVLDLVGIAERDRIRGEYRGACW